MSMKRTVFHVVPSAQPRGWAVTVQDVPVKVSTTKEICENWGRSQCRNLEYFGVPSQLVVHGKDGKFMTEYTYLNDPPEKVG